MLSAEQALQQFAAALAEGIKMGVDEVTPFFPGTEIESLNTGDLGLFSDILPNGSSLTCVSLCLARLSFRDYCDIQIPVADIDLSSTTVGGALILSEITNMVDLRGIKVEGMLELEYLDCASIVCDPDKAARIHLAAPTIPLVFKGL